MSKSKKKSKRSVNEDIYLKPLISLQRNYFQEYTRAAVDPIDSVRRALRDCIEGERGPKPLEKLLIEPPKKTKLKVVRKNKENEDDIVLQEKPPPLSGLELSVCIPPLCNAIRNQNFVSIKEIRFWEFPISLTAATAFADTLSVMKYPVQILEFVDCELCPESLNRLAISFQHCELLKSVSLDYNSMDAANLHSLLSSLRHCHKLLEISLSYCDMDSQCGALLGSFAASSVVRNLIIDGNNLELNGIRNFFDEIMHEFDKIDAQLEAIAAAEAAAAATAVASLDIDGDVINSGALISDPTRTENFDGFNSTSTKPPRKKKKRSRSKKRKKVEDVIPPVGPWLKKLHLADTFGGFSQMEHYHISDKSHPENQVVSQALEIMELVTVIGKFLMKCTELEELDLYNNWIGHGGGSVLLDSLKKRELAENPRIGMRINRGLDGDMLKKIYKIASGVKKKRRKRKKSSKKR